MSKLHQIKEYLKYCLKAKGPHGTHSPFVFAFIKDVLEDRRHFYAFDEIESLRANLLSDNTEIDIQDFGAGSLHNKANKRKISELTKNAGRSKKYGELLFRIANYFQLNRMLELGTSMGLATAYLAKAKNEATIVTLEGCPSIYAKASSNFQQLNINNVVQVLGNFDEVLQDVIQKFDFFDLIFIDGNHRKEPTLRYFEVVKKKLHKNALIIFDDIHWSEEMSAAWDEIKRDPHVKVSFDLFQFGLVFFMEEIKEKQNFILRY